MLCMIWWHLIVSSPLYLRWILRKHSVDIINRLFCRRTITQLFKIHFSLRALRTQEHMNSIRTILIFWPFIFVLLNFKFNIHIFRQHLTLNGTFVIFIAPTKQKSSWPFVRAVRGAMHPLKWKICGFFNKPEPVITQKSNSSSLFTRSSTCSFSSLNLSIEGIVQYH